MSEVLLSGGHVISPLSRMVHHDTEHSSHNPLQALSTDAVYIYAVIFASQSLKMLTGQQFSMEDHQLTSFYLGKVLRPLREQLSQAHMIRSTFESKVKAVLILVIFTEDFDLSQAHMNGLRALLEMKGEVQFLTLSPALFLEIHR